MAKQYKEHRHLRNNLRNCGQKQKLSPREAHMIIIKVRRNPSIPSAQLKNIEDEFNKSVIVKSV